MKILLGAFGLLLLLGCSSEKEELKPSATKVDFLNTRLKVSTGSAVNSADEAHQSLKTIRRLRGDVDLLQMDTEEVVTRTRTAEGRLRKF